MIDRKTITETLIELLPEEVELDVVEGGEDYVARFSWLLHTDPERTHKRSKTVELRICDNALQDFLNVGNKCEARVLIDLETYLKNQLYLFQPDHNKARGQPEPVVKWEISSLLFLETQKPLKGVSRRMF